MADFSWVLGSVALAGLVWVWQARRIFHPRVFVKRRSNHEVENVTLGIIVFKVDQLVQHLEAWKA